MQEFNKEVLYETINNLSQQVAMLSADKALLLAQLNQLQKQQKQEQKQLNANKHHSILHTMEY